MITLLVVENFLSHVKGELITDAKLVKQYLSSEWLHHVVQVMQATPEVRSK